MISAAAWRDGCGASRRGVSALLGGLRSVARVTTACAVFAVTFVAYSLFHVTRKLPSVIKPEVTLAGWFGSPARTTQVLAMMDTLYMAAYACGLFFSGMLADRYAPQAVVCASMLLSGLASVGIGALALAGSHATFPVLLLRTLDGLVQSTGWPACVAIMCVHGLRPPRA